MRKIKVIFSKQIPNPHLLKIGGSRQYQFLCNKDDIKVGSLITCNKSGESKVQYMFVTCVSANIYTEDNTEYDVPIKQLTKLVNIIVRTIFSADRFHTGDYNISYRTKALKLDRLPESSEDICLSEEIQNRYFSTKGKFYENHYIDVDDRIVKEDAVYTIYYVAIIQNISEDKSLEFDYEKETLINMPEGEKEWEIEEPLKMDITKTVQQQPQKKIEKTSDSTILDNINIFLNQIISNVTLDQVKEIAIPQIDSIIKEKYGFLPQIHEIHRNDKIISLNETTHEKFDEVLQLVNNHIPVYLSGEAGTGKNVICKQVAHSLELEFYFTNAVTQEYKLTGFIDANGTFHETQFYKAFTNGGLFFLDEMDASIPETLIILNAAIANGYFDFPTGKVEAHKDFYVIAAGNTTGTGADESYTGRYALDKASLDRFALVNIDYSTSIERTLSQNNEELIKFAHAFRKACKISSIKCLFTYRSIERISTLESFMPLREVIQISLLKGMSIDDIDIIKDNLHEFGINNKYTNAL